MGLVSHLRPMETTVRPPDARWILWLVCGLLAGTAPVAAAAVGLAPRYVLYGCLGLALLGAVPYLAAAAGSLNRLLWLAFILSLQLELAWAPMYWGYAKPAGPYGLLISPTLLIGAAIVAVWVAAEGWGDAERISGPGRGFTLAAAAFVAAALISMLVTPDRTLSAFGVFEIASLVLTAMVGAYGCGTRAGVRILYAAMLVIVVTQSVVILIEQVLGVQFSLAHGINTQYDWADGDHGRFAGTFAAPSVAATFLVVGLFFTLARLVALPPTRRPLAVTAVFALGFLALLLTRTRSAWIGFLLGGAGLGWYAVRNGRIGRRAVGALGAAACLALVAAWPFVQQRLSQDHAEAAEVRRNLIRIAAVMIASHPVTGVGVNTATNQVYEYAARAGIGGWVFIVHNQFLLVAAETGLPGVIALVLVIAAGARAAWRGTRAADPFLRDASAVVLWSLVALVWALNLDHVSGCKTYFLLWFLVGAACGLERQAAHSTTLGACDPSARAA